MAEVLRRYNAFVEDLKQATPDILKLALWPAWMASQIYVPVDKGDLKISGVFDTRRVGRNIQQAYITYGNANAWYAAIVHERLDMRHAAPTSAKYLQRAMEENFGSFMETIQANYKALMR
jgi:hypothetical protein